MKFISLLMVSLLVLMVAACDPKVETQTQPPAAGAQDEGVVSEPLKTESAANTALKPIIGVSESMVSADGQLVVRGYCLAAQPIKLVRIFADNQCVGTTTLAYKRPDVDRQYPDYKSLTCGFAYQGQVAAVGKKLWGTVAIYDDQDKAISEKKFLIEPSHSSAPAGQGQAGAQPPSSQEFPMAPSAPSVQPEN